jgi:hypothetical protein
MTLHLLNAAALPVSDTGIEQLRALPDKEGQPPLSFERYCSLVDLLAEASHPREEIQDLLEANKDQLVVAIVELARFMLATRGNPIVKVLGTWSEVHGSAELLPLPGLANAMPAPSSKRKQKTEVKAAPALAISDDVDQPTLFQDVQVKKRSRKPRASKAKANAAAPMVAIVLPDGFTRQELGKDIDGSLIAIVALRPTPAEINRFIQRNYSRSAQPLSFEMLTAIWTFARLRRLKGLRSVSETSSFVRNCVAAWDALEVARQSAMQALQVLVSSSDADALREATTKLLPVWEVEARNLQGLLDATGSVSPAFQRSQAWLAKRIAAGQLVVAHVAELNEGQIRRIATLSGLDTEVISRNEETYIRSKLADMNLSLDAEQLVPVGVAAVRKGLEDAFLDACLRRAKGDQNWAADLEAQLVG